MFTVFEDTKSIVEEIGTLWQKLQNLSGDKEFLIASPLSSTPLPLYKWVIKSSTVFKNWQNFRFVLMDEQVEKNNKAYIPLSDIASYEAFARKNFLEPLQKKGKIIIEKTILKPDLNNLKAFDRIIEKHNGIDLLILAIGTNGHYAHVMPGTKRTVGYHITKLIPELEQQHTKKGSKSYEGANFRSFGMSLGPKQLISAKKIIVMITGERKKELTEKLLSFDAFDPDFPMSIIYDKDVKYKTEVFLTKDLIGDGCGGNCNCGNGGCC